MDADTSSPVSGARAQLRVRFGAFTLDSRQRRLARDGISLDLAPKQFDALLLLVENASELVSKETFQARLWPDTIVSQTSLNKYIWQLRRILGESGNAAGYIETLPKLGYRFVAEVRSVATEPGCTGSAPGVAACIGAVADSGQVDSAAPVGQAGGNSGIPGRHANWPRFAALAFVGLAGLVGAQLGLAPPVPHPLSAISRIAVLPFKPLDAGDRDPIMELGIADSLIGKLSSGRRLTVPSINSVRRFDSLNQDPIAAGLQLGVGAVLEGQLQRRGNGMHVNARLLAVPGGAALWTGTYNADQTDVFAMQDTIAEHVAGALSLEFASDERRSMIAKATRDPEAYRLYLTGRYHINQAKPDEIRVGLDSLQKAIERDPTYALAYAAIAEGYERLPITGDVAPRKAFPLGKAAAARALEIDDTLAEAHNVLGWIAFWYDWDWANAEREFQRSIALNPNIPEAHHGYGHLLWLQGRTQQSRLEGRRARELDPLSPLINTVTASFEEPEERSRVLARAFALNPDFWIMHMGLGGKELTAKHYDDAIGEFTKAKDLSGGNMHAVAALGIALVQAGRTQEARSMIAELEARAQQNYVPGTSIAMIYAALGDKEPAIAWLQRAYDDRDVELAFLAVRPGWDPLRGDPRFAALVAGVGLEEK